MTPTEPDRPATLVGWRQRFYPVLPPTIGHSHAGAFWGAIRDQAFA
jgi:hypothetical protein